MIDNDQGPSPLEQLPIDTQNLVYDLNDHFFGDEGGRPEIVIAAESSMRYGESKPVVVASGLMSGDLDINPGIRGAVDSLSRFNPTEGDTNYHSIIHQRAARAGDEEQDTNGLRQAMQRIAAGERSVQLVEDGQVQTVVVGLRGEADEETAPVAFVLISSEAFSDADYRPERSYESSVEIMFADGMESPVERRDIMVVELDDADESLDPEVEQLSNNGVKFALDMLEKGDASARLRIHQAREAIEGEIGSLTTNVRAIEQLREKEGVMRLRIDEAEPIQEVGFVTIGETQLGIYVVNGTSEGTIETKLKVVNITALRAATLELEQYMRPVGRVRPEKRQEVLSAAQEKLEAAMTLESTDGQLLDIGRKTSSDLFPFEDLSVSREHAQIGLSTITTDDEVLAVVGVKDLDSTSGTRLSVMPGVSILTS